MRGIFRMPTYYGAAYAGLPGRGGALLGLDVGIRRRTTIPAIPGILVKPGPEPEIPDSRSNHDSVPNVSHIPFRSVSG